MSAMPTTERKREPKPATARLEAARAVKDVILIRELCLVSLLSRVWPSHLAEPRVPQLNFPWIVCLHSPAGQLVWRVKEEELALFEHLERNDRGENHGKDYKGTDKMALLQLMASDPTFQMKRGL